MPPAAEGKRQRFYARNTLKTTLHLALAYLMRSFRPSVPDYPTRIHPALTGFADECCGMLARLVVYVGVLALLAIAGVHLWDQLPAIEAAEPAAKRG